MLKERRVFGGTGCQQNGGEEIGDTPHSLCAENEGVQEGRKRGSLGGLSDHLDPAYLGRAEGTGLNPVTRR